MALFQKKSDQRQKSGQPEAKSAAANVAIAPNAVALFNCITGELQTLARDVILVGGDAGCHLLLTGYGVLGSHCRIVRTKTGVRLERAVPEARVYVDGNPEHTLELLATDRMFSLQIGAHHFFMLGIGQDGITRLQTLDVNNWSYIEKKTSEPKQPVGPFKLKELLELPGIEKLSRDNTILFLSGASVGFRLSQFFGNKKGDSDQAFTGEFQCPRCWLRFDLTDMLYIATHPELHGDDVLKDEMKRFRPRQFVNGRPVDEKGVPCSETACPHCRGKLPHGYHELPVHIFSIVGISSAGKSYYLALLIHHLKRFLFRTFNISLMDADGGENRVLNEMITQLIGAATPDEARLQKTTVQGITYKNFQRFGREVLLPQPFVYTARSQKSPASTSLLIFYDNAGEHFLPDQGEHTETTEHMAYCRTLFFLFDPVRHREFHSLIKDVQDPQVQKAWRENRRTFVQDTVLGEMQRRMQVASNTSAANKSDKPLAIIVGKYDLWEHLLPETELRTDIIVGGKLNLACVEHNSRKVRELMLEHCPDIVGCADAISDQVLYFPVSAFGSHAVEIKTKTDMGPDPEKLKPKFLEIPTVWALSRLMPEAIPSA